MKKCLLLLPVLLATITNAAPPIRLHRAIDQAPTSALPRHVRALPHDAKDLGAADSSLALPRVELHFNRTAAQAADLKKLLAAQRDRSSGWYHKWLTPEEFGARFGVNESDLTKIKSWLETAGFADVEIARSKTFLRMSGTAVQVNHAFGVEIHQYQRKGKTFFANTANPVLPKALASMVSGINGLTSEHVRPFLRRKPNITVGINGNHFLGPDDLATIYDLRTLYNQGTNGSGQKIAIVGQSDIDLSDITAFQTAAGLPIQAPQVVLNGTDPGIDLDSESEADLDLEWSGAVARGASIIYVNSTDALESAVYAIDNNIAPIVSISYGLCEAALSSAEMNGFSDSFEQANAQGITVVVSSGDSGAAACDLDGTGNGPEPTAIYGLAVSFPASSPYVTAVGGTEFDEAQGTFWDSSGHALSYIPEVGWNDTAVFGVLASSGGGVSQQFSKPDWQTGTGVPADGYRDLPDIALSSSPVHDPYLICSGGSCSNGFAPPVSQIYFVGGTSCAAPVFAGMLALLNQTSSGGQGNVNPALYALASLNSGVFHDVELGDNRVPCLAGTNGCQKGYLGYTAGLGYDQVTGLGSVDAAQLVEQWGADFQLAPAPAAITLAAGGTSITNLQLKRFANFAGAVSFTCAVSSSLQNTTCAVPSSVSGGSGMVTLTVSNVASGGLIPRLRSLPPSTGLPLLLGTGIALFGLLVLTRQKRWMPIGFAALCLLGATSCGNGTSAGSQPVSHSMSGTVTVTATSGTLQHAITIPVTVS